MTHRSNETDRLLKVKDIIRPGGILPICRSTFWTLVRTGVVSPGIRLGARNRMWRRSEIMALIDNLDRKERNNG